MDGIRSITLDQILQIVSDVTKTPIAIFTSRSRKREYVDTRKICATLMYIYTPVSLSAIAVKLGMNAKRHDSIIHYNKVLPDLMKTNERIEMIYDCADEEIMRYVSKGAYVKSDTSSDLITREQFVKNAMKAINWKEKGTTRANPEVLYYKMFKLKKYD